MTMTPTEPRGTGLTSRLRSGFGLLGPRHPRHTLSVDQVEALSLPIGDDGVVVGIDPEGQPAVLGVNRPTPYDILLISGLWTAQVLALRAAATGARVAVETGTAAGLDADGARDGRRPERPRGLRRRPGPPQGASAGTPVLVVRDCGMRPPRGRVTSAPWQSVLTLLPYLSPVAPRLMRQARLVGVRSGCPRTRRRRSGA